MASLLHAAHSIARAGNAAATAAAGDDTGSAKNKTKKTKKTKKVLLAGGPFAALRRAVRGVSHTFASLSSPVLTVARLAEEGGPRIHNDTHDVEDDDEYYDDDDDDGDDDDSHVDYMSQDDECDDSASPTQHATHKRPAGRSGSGRRRGSGSNRAAASDTRAAAAVASCRGA